MPGGIPGIPGIAGDPLPSSVLNVLRTSSARAVFQLERAEGLWLAGLHLLRPQYGVDVAEVEHGVHRLQAARLVQGEEFSVLAEHRLQLGGGRFRGEHLQRERHLDELVRIALRKIGRLDPRHEAGIEVLDIGNRQHFLVVAKQRVAAHQQVLVDQVADLRHRVAPPRGQIERIAGQILPVEAHARYRGQPFQHRQPGLVVEREADLARRVRPDLELVAIGRLGRRGGTVDRLNGLLCLRVFRLALRLAGTARTARSRLAPLRQACLAPWL